MCNIKTFLNRNKKLVAIVMAVMAFMAFSCVAFATDASTSVDIQSSFSSMINKCATDLMAYLGLTIACAGPVILAFFGVRKAVSYFLKLVRKD